MFDCIYSIPTQGQSSSHRTNVCCLTVLTDFHPPPGYKFGPFGEVRVFAHMEISVMTQA